MRLAGLGPRLAATVGAVVATALMTTGAVPVAASSGGEAPGAPGAKPDWPAADKTGFGTSRGTASKVWFTLEGGRLSEVYYPRLDTPSVRDLAFVVSDGHGFTVRTDDAGAARQDTRLLDPRSLTYRTTATDRHGRWRLTTTYVTDPDRATVLADVSFASLTGRPYQLYTVHDPSLGNDGTDDSARTGRNATLLAEDGRTASALAASPAFTATSSGYLGTSDGWTDLRRDHRMDWHYASADKGNVVQTARTPLTGLSHHRDLTLALGFGPGAEQAARAARGSLKSGFGRTAAAYASGWHRYLAGLHRPPAALHGARQRAEYAVSQMVLAASEDKTYRGAYVASPTMPWVWGQEAPSGPYHLVWSRDLYEIATALIEAGDRDGAGRALDYLFDVQQKPDGSFPQNSDVTGKPVWGGLQLDEVADPLILAAQLGRRDAKTWSHVKRAADFLIGFEQDGFKAPWSPQERWENQSGYSPATIASEIAGLVSAADIAKANGDRASAGRYLDTADAWRAHVKDWTVTHNGPYSAKPYFLRLSKNGDPDAGTTYNVGDSGPGAADQRTVVDPSFLELVRLGVLPANDPDVRNTLKVIDARLAVDTPDGRFWHRASFDGYGETATGAPWRYGTDPDSFVTRGRAWPLLNGERGEYELAAGDHAAARTHLEAIARTANSGLLLPEQVWDTRPPAGGPGFRPGTPTFSATPLAWTHAQYIRLANAASQGHPAGWPSPAGIRYSAR